MKISVGTYKLAQDDDHKVREGT